MARHHCETTQGRIKRYNQPLPLVDYLLPFVGDKKEIKIADIASGAFSTIGSYLPGIDLKIYHCDKSDFVDFWENRGITPIVSIEVQNMEALTYPDEFFDIVHCQNSLDHTRNAKVAVEEMIRICKPDGWVYINCSLNQLDTGWKHYWNVKEDGIVTNNVESFNLRDFGFQIQFIDNGGESRYNQINAVLQKK